MEQKHGKEVKIALVALLGVFVLFVGMNFLKGLNIFSKGDVYYISFQDVSGLASSSPIYADGYPVGTVRSIDYDYSHEGKTKVTIDIDPKMRIPKGSSAVIESDMLGNVRVNLLLANNPREKVMPGEVIPGDMATGLMAKAATLIPVVEKMLPKLDSILTSINTLLANPAIAQSLQNIQVTTHNLTATTNELNRLMAGLNGQVPGLVKKANGVLDNTQTLTGNLAQLDVATTLAKVDATMQNVQAMTDKLNSNDGTLGLLMRDASLYNHLSSTANDADSLLIDLKAHPKRYVHFSLFGRKEKTPKK
ncbi:MAG: MCE family protein [Prevotella sp.]|nr:MCE family protein [Prevotella sp.]